MLALEGQATKFDVRFEQRDITGIRGRQPSDADRADPEDY